MDISKLPYRPCVGIFLFNADAKVFVARRLDTPENAWQMPQGGIDDGEDPETAALRELAEETSITSVRVVGSSSNLLRYDLPLHMVANVWKGRYRGQEQKWFAMLFTGDETEIDTHGVAHAEFDDWRWVEAENLADHTVRFKRDVYNSVVAEFYPYVQAEFGGA